MSERWVKPILSVVLPVHNAEAFLPACLDSLLGQDLGDCEIIAVDDASTDRTADILAAYGKQDGRIRHYRNAENKNSFATRLFAFEHMRGEYFVCCDADDVVPPGSFSQLYAAAKRTHADVVHGRTLLLTDDGLGETAYWVEPFRVKTGRDFVLAMLRNRRGWNVWGKLFSRNALEQALPLFPQDKHWFTLDDFLTSASIGLQAGRYVALQQPVYYYRVPPVTHSVRSGGLDKWAADSLGVCAYLEQVIAAREPDGLLRRGIKEFTRDCLTRLVEEASSSPEARAAMETKIRQTVAPGYIAWAETRGLLGSDARGPTRTGAVDKVRNLVRRVKERGIRESYLRFRTKQLFAQWERAYQEKQND